MSIRISKNDSLSIKGVAVIVMILFHYGLLAYYIGVACVAMFAFVTGYAHQLIAKKNKGGAWSSGFLAFLSFYKRYLFAAAVVTGAIILVDLPFAWRLIAFTISVIKPNAMFDSWWYAFAFACYCLVLFPIFNILDNATKHKPIIVYIITVALSIASFCLPYVVFYECVPSAFRQVWDSIPILRSIMFIPYYLLGYTLSKSSYDSSHTGLICSGLITVLCIFWPFSTYTIDGIEAVDIGPAFTILTALTLWGIHRLHISAITEKIGRISLWLWLLHMPVITCIRHFLGAEWNQEMIAASSIMVSFLSAYLCAWGYGIISAFFSRKAPVNEPA